tara:strand:- start:471 stop:671 length:201 start_codon:yes stop_codon:yes gene_type:complete
MWPFKLKEDPELIYYQVIERKRIERIGIIEAINWSAAQEKVRCNPEEIKWQEETKEVDSEIQVDVL